MGGERVGLGLDFVVDLIKRTDEFHKRWLLGILPQLGSFSFKKSTITFFE